MWVFIIIVILLVVGAMLYLLKFSDAEKIKRKEFLQAFAYFYEGQVVPIAGHEKSSRIDFRYRGYDCSYEDIELPALRPGATVYVGYLKVKTLSNLSLTFTERMRTQIRSNAQSLEDVAKSRWGTPEGSVRLPKDLEDFNAYTNNPAWANAFINVPKNCKAFLKYKNRDSRGHPLMSLQISDGAVSLEFHSLGGLNPSILVLEHNVTAAEAYLQELIILAEALKISDQQKSK